MKHVLPLLLCAPLLAACVMEPAPVPMPPDDTLASCGADELQYLVGKPGVILDGMRFSQDVRVIQYGMAVTMDYSPYRLNFWLGPPATSSRGSSVARAALLALVLALAGCVSAEPEQNACGAAGMRDLVGQDKAVLAAMTFPAGTRVIEPGTAVTEDYSPSRLNIDVDAGGTITGVWCG